MRAPAGKTRISPAASRIRNPTARSSARITRSLRPVVRTRARYQTQGRLWSGETSVTSPASITPETRTSPAARLSSCEVDVSADGDGRAVPTEAAPQEQEAAADAEQAERDEVCRDGQGLAGITGTGGASGRRR